MLCDPSNDSFQRGLSYCIQCYAKVHVFTKFTQSLAQTCLPNTTCLRHKDRHGITGKHLPSVRYRSEFVGPLNTPTDGQELDQRTRPVESRHMDRNWIRGHALWKSRHMDKNWIRGEALWKAGTWTGIGSELTLQTYPETQIQRVIGASPPYCVAL